VSHERASRIFQEAEYFRRRRRPRDVEKKWPMRVRSMFSRLRSGQSTGLKAYSKRIRLDLSELCTHCNMGAVCVCPQLEELRRRLHPESFVDSLLKTQPENHESGLMG